MKQEHVSERGVALLLFLIFFLVASAILTIGIGRGVYDDVVLFRAVSSGTQSFYAAESGIEDALYRYRSGKQYSDTETIVVGNATTTVTRTLNIDMYDFISEGNTNGMIRRDEMLLAVGSGTSFNFGMQSGNGGITLSNNSKIYGNVFSNGAIKGQGNATTYGDIISSGPTGLVDLVTATGSVWSHAITSSNIGKDAYYTTMTGTIVGGTAHPGSPDQATAAMPIPDSKIYGWETDIQNTGSVIASTSPQCAGGTYVINTDTILNNVRIECNVDMRKQGSGVTITIAGPVWIEGNLSFSQGPDIIASSSLGSKSVPLIVHHQTNTATSSEVTVNQSTNFISGSGQSYVLIVSMNTSNETGGTETAINIAQSANGKVLVYAPHGLITMGNSISLREVTGYQINVNNGAQIIYESGLVNLLFTGGPGGGWAIQKWAEIP